MIKVGDLVVVRSNGALGTVVEIADGIYTVDLEVPDRHGQRVYRGPAESLALARRSSGGE